MLEGKQNIEIFLTVNGDCGRVAEPEVGNVLGHAGVVTGVCQPGSHNDEVSLAGDKEVSVQGGVDGPAVELPVGLWRGAPTGRVTTHLNLTAPRHLLRVRRNLEVTLQN